MEINAGQLDESKKTGIWIDEYYVDQTDPEKPVIWAAENGKLKKRSVTLGERDEELFKVQVLEGLTAEDYIAFPDETMKEGTPTITMEEMAAASEGEDGMAVSGGMAGEGMSSAGMHGVG